MIVHLSTTLCADPLTTRVASSSGSLTPPLPHSGTEYENPGAESYFGVPFTLQNSLRWARLSSRRRLMTSLDDSPDGSYDCECGRLCFGRDRLCARLLCGGSPANAILSVPPDSRRLFSCSGNPSSRRSIMLVPSLILRPASSLYWLFLP